jgi:virginiamycin B lyase
LCATIDVRDSACILDEVRSLIHNHGVARYLKASGDGTNKKSSRAGLAAASIGGPRATVTGDTLMKAGRFLVVGCVLALLCLQSDGVSAKKVKKPKGVTEFSSGISATDPLAGPWDITAGPDGNLWFTEPGISRIGRITSTGLITEFSAGITAAPYGITAGPDGNLWFTEPSGNRIGQITRAGVVTEFDPLPTAGATPTFITKGPDGNLWFIEPAVAQIGRITTTGVVTEFSAGVPVTGAFLLGGITGGPDGNVWFTEFVGQIGRITPTGVVTQFSAGITVGAGLSHITTGSDGNLWFTELNLDKIGQMTPTGVVTEFNTGTSALFPYAITAGPDGNLWFTKGGAATEAAIGRITTVGVVTEFTAGITFGAEPAAITTGLDGDLWFTEANIDRVARLRPR